MVLEKHEKMKILALIICGVLLIISSLFIIPNQDIFNLLFEKGLRNNLLYPLFPNIIFLLILISGISVISFGIYNFLKFK